MAGNRLRPPNELEDSATASEQRRAGYPNQVNPFCRRRRFFRTSGRYIGLGPQCLVPGDVLAIVTGCPSPVVVRAVPGHAGNYWSVGLACIYGIVWGEAVEKMQAEGRCVEKFALI